MADLARVHSGSMDARPYMERLGSVVVVDIGATYIRIGSALSVLPQEVLEAPTSYDILLRSVTSGVQALKQQFNRVFVASPGLITHEGAVAKALYSCVSGHHLRRDLEMALNCSVTVWNDANAQAFGAYSRIKEVVVYTTIGTAVGGSILINGKPITGKRGFASEVGHIPVPRNSRSCPCGQTGCLDTLASGWSIDSDLGPGWHENCRFVDRESRLTVAGAALARAYLTLVTLLDPSIFAINGHLAERQPFLYSFGALLPPEGRTTIAVSNNSWLFTVNWASCILGKEK